MDVPEEIVLKALRVNDVRFGRRSLLDSERVAKSWRRNVGDEREVIRSERREWESEGEWRNVRCRSQRFPPGRDGVR